MIERSRFITTLERAASADEARTVIDRVRAEYPDASHNCWAYIAGPPGYSAAAGFSDAGEPHGTAGRPMLDVLLHSGIGEVVAVATRYFGGTKLGKGGLVRAYGGCVQRALASLPTLELVQRREILITVAYTDVELVRRLLQRHDGVTLGEEYGAQVQYRAAVAIDNMVALRRELADATSGRAVLQDD